MNNFEAWEGTELDPHSREWEIQMMFINEELRDSCRLCGGDCAVECNVLVGRTDTGRNPNSVPFEDRVPF